MGFLEFFGGGAGRKACERAVFCCSLQKAAVARSTLERREIRGIPRRIRDSQLTPREGRGIISLL